MTADIPRGAPGARGPTAVPQGTLANGMLVFFDRCKKSAFRKAQQFTFRGQGFGILLGVIPQFGKDPTREQVVGMLAGVGFVLLDDVADFLGDEQAQIFTDKFHQKYDAKTEEAATPLTPEPPRLIGVDGTPLEREPGV